MNRSLNRAWLLVCIPGIALPLSTMVAMARKLNDTQSTDKLANIEKHISHSALNVNSIDNIFLRNFSDDFSRQQLISYLISERQLENLEDNGRDPYSILIQEIRSQPKLRKQVADAIFIELHCVKIQHDNSHLPVLLGKLKMPDHLTALLAVSGSFDCCYGPSLVRSLAACASIDYTPIVIKSFDKETEVSLGCVQAALLKMTGCPSNQNKTKEDWITWWRKTYPNKELEPPSDKYRHLLADDRIVLIQKLRNIMSAMHKYGENKIGPCQYGPPSFPQGLNELVGREYTLGKKITEQHIQSVKYRKPSKDVWPPFNSLFLADDSLEQSHGLIAIVHGEGRIYLVKPDDSGAKLEMVRMFWPDKWKEPPNVVGRSN